MKIPAYRAKNHQPLNHWCKSPFGYIPYGEYPQGGLFVIKKRKEIRYNRSGYAGNNAQTVADAIGIARKHAAELRPNEGLLLCNLCLSGRTYSQGGFKKERQWSIEPFEMQRKSPLQKTARAIVWSWWPDLNRWPHPYQCYGRIAIQPSMRIEAG